jgi:two-component system NtrC family sensor kinase
MSNNERHVFIVIDDVPAIVDSIVRIVSRVGSVTPVGAKSGTQGLEMIREHQDEVFAVLCDVEMPDLDGAAIWRIINQENPELASRFVFMTGNVGHSFQERITASTGCRVVTKPFDIHDVLEQVVQTIDDRMR